MRFDEDILRAQYAVHNHNSLRLEDNMLHRLCYVLGLSIVLSTTAIIPMACTSQQPVQPSGPAMSFELIGQKGAMYFVTLVSPSPDTVSQEQLATRLAADWQTTSGNLVDVKLFDNKDAPTRWLEIWDRLAQLSDQQWAVEEARIYPHFVAQYIRNRTSGLHEVKFLSRTPPYKVTNTITIKAG